MKFSIKNIRKFFQLMKLVFVISCITSVYASDYLGVSKKIESLVKTRDSSLSLIFRERDGSIGITFPCNGKICEQSFYKVPLPRANVFMNIVVLTEYNAKNKKAILAIKGGEANIELKGLLELNYDGAQYLYNNQDIFLNSNIALVATGCPTDKVQSYNACGDGYRKSQQYADDFKVVIDFLKKKYEFESFYVFGHSSGGISTRWLSLYLDKDLAGAINSSVMNTSRGTDSLAYSTVGFDMNKIKIPVLNISHKDDACPSTPYFIVKNYSKNNLVTVLGGGASGPLCENTNHHSFEGRQRGVSRAIAKWVSTGEVQEVVDNDD